jgi:hypothetical protein
MSTTTIESILQILIVRRNTHNIANKLQTRAMIHSYIKAIRAN